MGYDRIIKAVVWRYGHDKTPEDREDFNQECEVVLLEEREKLDSMPKPEAIKYAYVACENRIKKLLRKNRPALSLMDSDVKEELDKNPEFLKVDDKILAEETVQFLDKLPAPYPEILRRRFGIGGPKETLAEIGKSLNMPPKTVQRREKQGLKMLKRRLNA
jgi:RNA polymerase sigma factor (sigma-70 family)